MNNIENKKARWLLDIDFSQLMDLRVDYAFKLLFGGKDTRHLISLLNATFANKNIPRVIKSLTVVNPYLERHGEGDKLAILDIRAQLSDGTVILIEMHLYDLGEFKFKTIRSWARAFGEELAAGQDFSMQPSVICIAFINNAINNSTEKPIKKIHSLYQILERDDHDILSGAMELHYINMNAFIEGMNKSGGFSDTQDTLFTKWLAIITQQEIKNKTIIEEVCREEELLMAIEALSRFSEDKIARQAYQRRRDEWLAYNSTLKKEQQRADLEQQRADLEQQRADLEQQRADRAEALLADKEAALADKEAALANKNAEIEELLLQLAKLQA